MASLFCPRSACLRSVVSAGRSFTAPVRTTAAFSTMALRPSNQPQHDAMKCSRRLLMSQFQSLRISTSARRAASSSAADTKPLEPRLTWDRFFDLRRKRRWINLAASLATSVAAVGILTPVLANQDLDAWAAQLTGLDPVMVLGISTFAVAAAGWLCGPTFGTAMFGLWAGRRGWNTLIAQKEKSFYARIKRYRADAASSSPQNPLPDYYGEKIGSVKDYRRWLKDQRAFNLKKNKNLI